MGARLEEIEEGELPVALLASVSTFADLVGIVRAWSTMRAPELLMLNNTCRAQFTVAKLAMML